MLNNKVKYILVLFIILSLSMNAFSATNFTDDSSDATLQSSSVDEVAADEQTDDSQDNGDTDTSDNTKTEDTKPKTTFGGNGTGFGGNGTGLGFGNGTGLGFGNGTGFGGNGSGFDFGNMTGRGGNNTTDFDISQLLDILMKLMGGNETNATNETVDPEVSDVPEVVTSTSYAPVSQAPAEKHSTHIVQRLRDNTTVSSGDALRLEGINKLFDSDFTNGHLLVYVDGKLVFNEITAGDLSTPIFWITDDYLGQHQITVEFTANGSSNTNKYTEDVLII